MDTLSMVLKELLQRDLFEDSAKEVVEKIIKAETIDHLSTTEHYIYNQHVSPLLDRFCDNSECGDKIDFHDLYEALINEFEEGGLLCGECMHQKSKMRYLAEKDE